MGDHSEHVHKRLRTVDMESQAEQGPAQPPARVEDADAFEHVKEGSGPYDAQTYGTLPGRLRLRSLSPLWEFKLYDCVPGR